LYFIFIKIFFYNFELFVFSKACVIFFLPRLYFP